MQLEDGTCYGNDFQNGRLKGYASVEEYVSARQSGKCECCGKSIAHFHHLTPRSQCGSNLPENLVGLCEDCHSKVHTGQLALDLRGIRKKYGALSVLNQAIPYIYRELVKIFGAEHVHVYFGYQTKTVREQNGLPKTHAADGVCIATIGAGLMSVCAEAPDCYEIRQFRRHNRQNIHRQTERTYRLEGKTVCKNRKARFEQPKATPSLQDWYQQQCLAVGKRQAQHMRSRLTVKESKRYYNAPKRIQPGAVFLYRGEPYILLGQLSGGTYFRAYGHGTRNFPVRECTILRHNAGLVYV